MPLADEGITPNNPGAIYSGPQSPESPGGFVFGNQAWTWGQPKARGITFFLDNTAKVADQHGRPIPGILDTNTNKTTLFAKGPPEFDPMPHVVKERAKCATHAQVIAALVKEGIDWQSLTLSGWPQLPYEELKKLKVIPNTPIRELRKITDIELRRAALRVRKEADEARRREMMLLDEEEEQATGVPRSEEG